MQRDVTASWLLAGVAASFLMLATLADAWCSESGSAAAAANGELVYVPTQSFQPVSDASGRYRAHVRGLVPVMVEREAY